MFKNCIFLYLVSQLTIIALPSMAQHIKEPITNELCKAKEQAAVHSAPILATYIGFKKPSNTEKKIGAHT